MKRCSGAIDDAAIFVHHLPLVPMPFEPFSILRIRQVVGGPLPTAWFVTDVRRRPDMPPRRAIAGPDAKGGERKWF